ncbi:hypothetical protein [Alteromonas sp. BMJM2]|uniref:hypothetical protein n=1 Tax=Alteromonas sp. BMJM2 TaxID=2954241 RepID=UPI0022B3EDD7|nr:hypothetical protein [Alteromonas sp. BMJM2]
MTFSFKSLLRFTCTILVLCVLSGCLSPLPSSSKRLHIDEAIILPSLLSETSGLFCADDYVLSINDSGNAPAVFKVSYSGKLQQTLTLPIKNNDWEAVSADADYLYVADIGNNKGQREEVAVYKVNQQNVKDIKTLSIKYAANNVNSNIPYAHDYDAEAMVKKGNELLLFSKSWSSGITHVYRINEGESLQVLSPFASISGLPGVVTGADYDSIKQQYVIVGYKSDPFGNFAAFIAEVSKDFTLTNIWPLEGYKQVEGVCVDKRGNYWFTEEKTENREASLTKAFVL